MHGVIVGAKPFATCYRVVAQPSFVTRTAIVRGRSRLDPSATKKTGIVPVFLVPGLF